MKKIYIILVSIACVFVFGCNSEHSSKNSNDSAIVKFENTTYDFGEIKSQSNGACFFEFTNNSKTDLLINVVRTTCGCTRPEWPKEPIKPGEKGEISITYNTKIIGKFYKAITVYSNTANSPTKLFIKGNVNPE